MTAKDAKFWAEQAAAAGKVADPRQTEIALAEWHKAIEAEAKKGGRSLTSMEVGRVRTPISPAAQQAALDRLTAAGFKVEQVGGAATVSW